MTNYEEFKLWYATGVSPNNTFATATIKLQNTTTPAGEEISLIYCNPLIFAKRSTDVSNAIAVDPRSPDTGTGASDVVLRFASKRGVTPRTVSILDTLLEMFYQKGNDDTFESGRFGLENDDNPELDVLPIPTAGYKFLSFRQEPNQNDSAIQIWEIHLKFLGDHNQLGTRS